MFRQLKLNLTLFLKKASSRYVTVRDLKTPSKSTVVLLVFIFPSSISQFSS